MQVKRLQYKDTLIFHYGLTDTQYTLIIKIYMEIEVVESNFIV